jgi:hypothetical protein
VRPPMRRISHLALAALVALVPMHAFAAKDSDDKDDDAAKPKKAKAAGSLSGEEEAEAARAQAAGSAPRKRARKAAAPVKAAGAAPAKGAPAAAAAPKDDDDEAKTAPAPDVVVASTGDAEEDFEEHPIETVSRVFPARRLGYIVGLAFGGVGLIFAYQAQGEAKRAQTVTSAADAKGAIANAQSSSTTADVLYGLAAASVILALVLEFLPEPVAQKAALTFHF